jgi:hypothetical protein
MGGLATQAAGTRRYQKEEFYKLAAELLPKIEKAFNTKAVLTLSYRNKESFGDMDILVLNDGNPKMTNAKEIIQETFNPQMIIANTGVYSFDHQDLQIDLIFTPTRNWETSQIFFAYNDLGNLMGKIFHRFGLKYGFDGIKYIYRINNDRVLDKITVTKNMPKAFEFLGLSWERFQEGFNDLEEIFDYIIASPYFNPESFKLENLNAINRRRNNRRKVYNQFVEYVKDMEPKFEFQKNKDEYLQMIHDFFPEANLLEKIEELKKEEIRKKANHAKFNGNLIMQKFPNLQGASLGKIIAEFQKHIGDITFEDYLYSNTTENIMLDFTKFYQNDTK